MIYYKNAIVLNVGDIVHHHGDMLRVLRKKPHIPCHYQCGLFDAEEERCSGFCWRWKNFDDIVFKKASDFRIGDDIVITETEFQEQCRRDEEERIKNELETKEQTIQ